MHQLIHKFQGYTREQCFLEDRLPFPINKRIRVLDYCVESVWDGVLSVSQSEEARCRIRRTTDYILLREVLNGVSLPDVCESLRLSKNTHPLHWAAMTGTFSQLYSSQENSRVNEVVNGMSPLFVACLFGEASAVQELLKRGAHADFTFSKWGISCLHIACWGQQSSRLCSLSQLCVQNLASFLRAVCKEGRHVSALLPTLMSRRYPEGGEEGDFASIVKALVSHGADVDCVTKDGLSPLFLLCENNNLEAVKVLVGEYDVKYDEVALLSSICNSNVEMCDLIVKNTKNVVLNTDVVWRWDENELDEIEGGDAMEDMFVSCVRNSVRSVFRYLQNHLSNLFAGAWESRDVTPLPVNQPMASKGQGA